MNNQECYLTLVAALVRLMTEEDTVSPGACAFGRHAFTLWRGDCAFCLRCAKVVRLVVPVLPE